MVEQYARACDREAQSKTAAAAAAEAWTNAGRAYHSLGRSAEAVQRLREALRCDPGRFEVRLLLGSCLLETRDFDEAVTHLKWCVHKPPATRRRSGTWSRLLTDNSMPAAGRYSPQPCRRIRLRKGRHHKHR